MHWFRKSDWLKVRPVGCLSTTEIWRGVFCAEYRGSHDIKSAVGLADRAVSEIIRLDTEIGEEIDREFAPDGGSDET